MRLNELRAIDRKGLSANGVSTPEQLIRLYLGKYDHVFVSMTNLPKLGINPQSAHETPIGVYAYEGEYTVKTSIPSLPFQADAKYINIFSIKESAKVLDLLHYTQPELNRVCQVLKTKVDDTTFTEALKQACYDSRNGLPGNIFWYLTHNIVRAMTNGKQKKIVQWNKLIRECGYDVVIDHGTETIHENEPYQIVVLDPSQIVPLQRLNNPYRPTSFGSISDDSVAILPDSHEGNFEKQLTYLKSLGLKVAAASQHGISCNFICLVEKQTPFSTTLLTTYGITTRPISIRLAISKTNISNVELLTSHDDQQYINTMIDEGSYQILDHDLLNRAYQLIESISEKPPIYWIDKDPKLASERINDSHISKPDRVEIAKALLAASTSFKNKLARIELERFSSNVTRCLNTWMDETVDIPTIDCGQPGTPWYRLVKKHVLGEYSEQDRPIKFFASKHLNRHQDKDNEDR